MYLVILACLFNSALSADESIRFLLNDPAHQGMENRVVINKLNASIVNTALPTVFLAHGFIENGDVYYYKDIPAEFLKKGAYNIIAMDWGQLAGNLLYPFSASNTKIAGDAMGEMIVALNGLGLDLDNVHVVGHSLGSHVAGYAGQYVQNHLMQSIGRITGLDPAGPYFYKYFQMSRDNFRLSFHDAKTVVILHTDRGVFGLNENIGTVDFNANYGYAIQPGCFITNFFDYSLIGFIGCSHQMSVRFFTESINSNGFKSTCLDGCEDGDLSFGPDVPAAAAGLYRFRTNSYKPYAKN